MTTTTASHDVWSTPLTPLAFLGRAAEVFADREAVVYGERRMTYAQLSEEVTRVAQALRACGVGNGDRVAYLLPNIPEMLVAQFAVPLAGGVLVAVNTRLAPPEVKYILEHSGASVLVVDAALHPTVRPVLADLPELRQVVTVTDPAGGAKPSPDVPGIDYAELCARGSDDPLPWTVEDERSTISINYTSGTTGRPKGVMYHHRGAYLNSLSEIIHSRHVSRTRYLWTLPMFHCNGWCTGWAVTAIGGTHVCLRAVVADRIWDLLDDEGITHLNGSPTVLVSIANSPRVHTLKREVIVTTAGSAPSATVISTMEKIGAKVVHVYGLTETYGPYTICEPQDGWDELDVSERSKLLARQGVGMVVTDGVRVVDDQMRDVPRDGTTLGEVVMRGNNVMKGYFADPEATADAFNGGWFHSGDLGVWHPDGYLELRDRAKDIIVSGGENISTIEVEAAIDSYPGVLEVAVVGVPDAKWGERPKAFVVAREGATPTAEQIIAHVRTQIAHYKAPDQVELVESLPKTATGKIRKVELRETEWAGHSNRVQG
ncbi:long-chain-fatty-acid--CoA ligase [Lapillicoccus sp.]|uniref:long-chain-fatty-acid--CoA ligase n=1 Tax=Lapillicoccus sp. TaxID=1909287 RepID=UPI00398335C4